MACILRAPTINKTNPFELGDVPQRPAGLWRNLRSRVEVCRVCRTDLHVVEGGLPPRKSPVIPGHQALNHVAAIFELGGTSIRAVPCVGIIDYCCLKLSGVKASARLQLYGFGAAGHVAIQGARYWDKEVRQAAGD